MTRIKAEFGAQTVEVFIDGRPANDSMPLKSVLTRKVCGSTINVFLRHIDQPQAAAV
jgi:hypothetical protein